MSDMIEATFTVRDLNRHPGKVLKACDHFGSVSIRTRGGKVYSLRVQQNETPSLPDFRARRKAAGIRRMTTEVSDALDRLIAGE